MMNIREFINKNKIHDISVLNNLVLSMETKREFERLAPVVEKIKIINSNNIFGNF